MCVIQVFDEKKANPDMIVAGFRANDHGSGVAWREKKGDKLGVKWKKGIQNPDEVVALVEGLELPYVVHHRIASIGPKIPEMTHPFPCTKDVSTDLEGWTDKAVLFHNGTWSEYRHKMYEAALLKGVKLPRGPFSDTRMMAWLYHLLGEGFLDDISEKVILFKPDDIEIFGQSRGWTCVDGVWCSNSGFTSRINSNNSRSISFPQGPVTPLRQIADSSKKTPQGGERQQPGFRPGPTPLVVAGSQEARHDQQAGPEGRPAGISTRLEHGIICVVENVGDRPKGRHALTTNPTFVSEVKKLTGQGVPQLSKSTSRADIIGNPKRFRSSGRRGTQVADIFGGVIDPGWAATSNDSELVRRRKLAAMGASPVIM